MSTELDLSNDEEWLSVLSAHPSLGKVTVLDLRSNNITDDEAVMLCTTFLPHMTSLKELWLHSNNIRHASSLFPSVCSCSSLELLYIDSNGMTGAIGGEVGRMVNMRSFSAHSNNLTSVDLSLFMIPTLEVCYLGGNINMTQPPYEMIERCGGGVFGNCMPKMREEVTITSYIHEPSNITNDIIFRLQSSQRYRQRKRPKKRQSWRLIAT